MAIKISKKQRTALILGATAVAAYFLYRWYVNKQSSSGTSQQLGTNLNSIAPALIAGSSGPSSGLTYNAGTTEVFTTNPITQPASGGSTGGGQTGGGSGSGSGSGSGGGILNWFSGGQAQSGTVQQFLQSFQATGQNAGTIVPGGTGKPIPLPKGKSYTS
jgi:hypothetical protein